MTTGQLHDLQGPLLACAVLLFGIFLALIIRVQRHWDD